MAAMIMMLRYMVTLFAMCAALIVGAGALGGMLPSQQIVVGANYYDGLHGLHVLDVERGLREWIVGGLRGGAVLSPDFTTVAFSEQSGDIYTVDVRDGSEQQVWSTPEAGATREIAWSPDGTTMAFTFSSAYDTNGNSRYFLYLLNGTTVRVLIEGEDQWALGGIAWSPDGTRIAFSATDNPMDSAEIFVIDTADGAIERLSPEGLIAGWVAWSPDSTQIAFAGYDGADTEIYRVNADGGDMRNLTQSPAEENSLPNWSPDGSRIVFAAQDNNFSHLYTIQVDGTDLRPLTTYEAVFIYEITWSSDSSQVGTILFDRVTANWQIDIFNVDGSRVQTFISSQFGEYAPLWLP